MRFTLLASLTAAFLSPAVAAQTDSLRCHFDRVGSVLPSSDESQDVVVAAGYLYIADRFGGLQIYDITDPGNPTFAGSLHLSGGFRRLVHSGNVVLVGTETAGLRRISVADPTTPISTGRVALNRQCRDIAIDGDTTYVANLADGLKIIHTPQTGPMSLISTYTPAGGAAVFSVAVRGGVAAIGHDNGLDFIDVSDPASPAYISSAPGVTDRVTTVALGNAAAYVGLGMVQDGLRIFDVTDPTTPVDAGSLDIMPGLLRMHSNLLYVQTGNESGLGGINSILTLDLTDPLSPVVSGTAIGTSAGFAVENGRALTAGGANGVTIIEITPPLHSPVRRTSAPDQPSTSVDVGHVAASPDGNLGYYRRPAANGDPARLYVIDLDASPETPPLGFVDLPSPQSGDSDIKAGDGVVYLSGFQQPLTAVDTSDPTSPFIAGSTGSPSPTQQLVVQGDWVYGTGMGISGIAVHDATDPAQIHHVANVNPPGNGPVSALTAFGPDLLVAGRSFSGIQVLDASNPPGLTVIGSLGDFQVTSLTTQGDIVFALNYNENPTLRAIDLSDPTNPVLLGQYEWGEVWEFTHAGLIEPAGNGLLAVSLTIGEIVFMDVSDPTDMKSAGTLPAGTFEFANAGPDRLILQLHGLVVVDTSGCAGCAGDFNGDGQLNIFDVADYLLAYNNQDPAADLAEPFGEWNLFDLFSFLTAYSKGCP